MAEYQGDTDQGDADQGDADQGDADSVVRQLELEEENWQRAAGALERAARLPPAALIGGAALAGCGPGVLGVAEYALVLDGSRDFAWLRPGGNPDHPFWHASDVDVLHADGFVAYSRTEGNSLRCGDASNPSELDCDDLAWAISAGRRGPHCAGRHGVRDLAARVRLEHERRGASGLGYDEDLAGFQDSWRMGPWPEIAEKESAGRRCSCAMALRPWYEAARLFRAPRPGRLARYFAHRLVNHGPDLDGDRCADLAKALGREPARPFRAIL